MDIDFLGGTRVIDTVDRQIRFRRTNANITDPDGNLLFSTNGAFLGNAAGVQMQGGGGLNPSWYTSEYPNGLHIAQNVLILPKPDDPHVYYLIHGTIDEPGQGIAQYLYLTTVDMVLDGGLGGVTGKNEVLIDDDLNVGHLTGVRHANGRDWWVFCHKVNTNEYYRLLVTPDGVEVQGTQSIGMVRPPDNGQSCFSPDGSKYVYYWSWQGLELFHFDRCTGLFSGPYFSSSGVTDYGLGVAFSPDGRFVYTTLTHKVYQFDTEAPDIATSQVLVAEWDGFYSPSPPFATLFDIAQLAPDGKIYIATGNSTLHLHVIHDPDQPGLACNLEQHGVELPRYFMNSLPNHPNYHLGALSGTVCDSLGLSVGLSPPPDLTPGPSPGERGVTVRPNPSTGAFTLTHPVQAAAGQLEVLDAAGRIVHTAYLAPWSQLHHLELHQPPGLYHCRLRWNNRALSTRIMIVEP